MLEAADAIGTETSSRKSEVIHAGIYYPAGSAMARLCVAGKWALYDYCRSHDIPHKNCGKLIVATAPAETAKLVSIRAHATANGVDDMRLLSGAEAHALEPALACDAALLSPSTGIIDSHAYMLALRGAAEDAGAAFAFLAPLLRASTTVDGFVVDVGGDAPMQLGCRALINCAGLATPAVARRIEGMPPELVPQAYYAKGNYFSCSIRCRSRAASACISRWIWQDRRGSDPTSSGSTKSITGSIRRGPSASIRRYAATGRRCRTARCCPAIRGYGRRSSRLMSPCRIS